jgi:hypothetical protein
VTEASVTKKISASAAGWASSVVEERAHLVAVKVVDISEDQIR